MPVGKAARNEGRKLLATFMNNAALAWFAAAGLQPALSVWRDGHAFGPKDAGASFIFFVFSVILFSVAQLVVIRIED